MFAYPRIAERLFGRAHAIEPVALRAILEGRAIRRVLSGEAKHDDVEVKSATVARRARLAAYIEGETVVVDEGCEYVLTENGVAVVPVFGVLAQRFDWLSAACGWATYEGIIRICDALSNDQRVKGAMFNFESPGGEVAGMLDAADAIITLNQRKPVWSIANAYAFSAAYALAGSSEMLSVPRMGEVGSIGTVIIHVDESDADALMGLKYSAVFSGARKIDGWDHAPLTDAARQVMQDRVDYGRSEFAGLVGRQGRITAQQAIETEAAIYTDRFAVEAGLANQIANFDEAMEQLTQLVAGGPRSIMIGANATIPTKEHKMSTTNAPKTAAQIAQEKEIENKVEAGVAEKLASVTAQAKAEGKAEAAAEAKSANEQKPPVAETAEQMTVRITAEVTEKHKQILAACTIAGVPEKANEFIAAGKDIPTVLTELQALRVSGGLPQNTGKKKTPASQAEINPRHSGADAVAEPDLNSGNIYANRAKARAARAMHS